MARPLLIDREFLEKLERLTIQWQKSFPGLVGGHNMSRFAGPGQEFLDHRHFHHGDDLRAVNWRAYLRLEKLFLKMFQVEPRVPVRLLLDTSPRRWLPAARANSISRAAWRGRSAMWGWYGWTACGCTRSQSGWAQCFVSSGGRHRFGPVADHLNALGPAGRTDFTAVVREFMSSYPQRGLVIVISDFLSEEGCDKPLEYLCDYGHELMLLQLWSEEDRTPPWLGELDLQDAETGAHMKLQFDENARERYTRAFDEYANAIQQVAARSGGQVRAGSPRRCRWRMSSSGR